jgi:hypothetical protein
MKLLLFLYVPFLVLSLTLWSGCMGRKVGPANAAASLDRTESPASVRLTAAAGSR